MKTVTETRNVSGFQRFELRETANCVRLIVEPGEPERLMIKGSPEYVARVKSEVIDETLKVSLTGGLTDKLKDALTTSPVRKSVAYQLIAKNLVEIELTGLIRVNLEAYGDHQPVIKECFPKPPIQPCPTG
jgi:hypothetical protein